MQILSLATQTPTTFFEWIALIVEKYWLWFLQGAATTLFIAITGTVIGFFIGLLVGVIRTIPMDKVDGEFSLRNFFLKIVNFLLGVYIEVFRGTPMIVQAMIFHYGLTEGFGIDLHVFTSSIIIVSINTGAYMAEIIRGGIESIDPGQKEAAHAIGMTHTQTMINVILPQAIRNVLPATGNEFVINIKDTSVLNAISLTELFFMAKSIKGALYRAYEPYIVAAAVYLFLTFTITRILRYFEKKLDGSDGYTIHTSSTMPESNLKNPGKGGTV